MLVRWPTCAVVLQTLPIEEEARPMSATICYWDLQTRATTRTSQVEVHGRVHMIEFDLEAKLLILALEEAVHIYSTNDDRLVSRTVCHPFEFRTKDLPVYKLSEAFLDHGSTILASSQIYVCTAFLMDDKEGFKQTVIPLRWRAVEDTCLNPSCMRTDTLADFVRGYSLRPSGIVLQGSEMRPYNIQLDLASDTLITSFCWGVSLVRPFSWLSQPDLLPQVQVALVHYRLLYRRSPHVDETVAHVCDSVFSQSRICQALHEGTDGDTTYTHLVLIDLQHHRLNPLWQKKQSHFFEDVRLWHLESRSETVEEVNDPSHPGFDLDGEQPWDVVDRVRELYMDATTIYIWRAKTGLHYIDFGIAAKNASKIASAAPPKDQE
ncbi:hypothetical protein CBOM_02634 [Ceraceosorus bombacis]|uniref:WD40/YVTN repeat-like-containing domain n=1 Tax=Ceraceosorus bombacis TaxID=401625 RepID=A0A0P1BF44_9BASI|nr:hypothetical protein CBOM_02634 [Ceraceosorus bombacis]